MKTESEHRLLRIDLFLLTIILVVAFIFRLYKIDTPLGDFHSWRQADTAAVARNYVRDGINLLQPRFDDFSNVASGMENPQGYRFVEFPIYNALIAVVYKLLPFLSLVIWGRLISIISSLIVIAVMYYFVYKEHSRVSAVISSVIFATFPFFVFWSRVILPEMNALAFSFLALFFSYKYFQEVKTSQIKVIYFVLGVISFATALLIKPTAIFYSIPILYLFIVRYKFQIYKQLPFYLFFVLSIIPLLLWRKYILQYPEGIPFSSWLITSVNTSNGLQNIFFRPAFFRWVFFERINNLILGGYTAGLFLIGVLVRSPRYFLHSIIVAALAYLFVFQGGNVQHVYYQTLILPALAIGVGMGAYFLIQNSAQLLSKVGVYTLIIFTLCFSFLISYYQVKDYYNYPQSLVDIARYITNTTEPDDKIVTDTIGDTTLLYLADRKGAANVFKGLPELKQSGYKYFVTLSADVAKQLKAETDFEVVGGNEKFTMFKL